MIQLPFLWIPKWGKNYSDLWYLVAGSYESEWLRLSWWEDKLIVPSVPSISLHQPTTWLGQILVQCSGCATGLTNIFVRSRASLSSTRRGLVLLRVKIITVLIGKPAIPGGFSAQPVTRMTHCIKHNDPILIIMTVKQQPRWTIINHHEASLSSIGIYHEPSLAIIKILLLKTFKHHYNAPW